MLSATLAMLNRARFVKYRAVAHELLSSISATASQRCELSLRYVTERDLYVHIACSLRP